MQSTRLPGKVLLPLPQPDGEKVLKIIVDRIKESKKVDAVIIAIPDTEADIPLFNYTKNLQNADGVIRGSEINVLQRFIDATELSSSEYIIRLTGDNPLIDTAIIDEAISYIQSNSSTDYLITTGLPIGLNIEVVKTSALKACASLKDLKEIDKEHVTIGIRSRPDLFNTATLDLTERWKGAEARFTLDTEEDYTFLNAIFYCMKINKYPYNLEYLQLLLKQAPWLVDINKNVMQKQVIN